MWRIPPYGETKMMPMPALSVGELLGRLNILDASSKYSFQYLMSALWTSCPWSVSSSSSFVFSGESSEIG